MVETVAEVIEAIRQNKDRELMPTGFAKLDHDLDGGFFKKELIIIGAHTGIGKSIVAGQLMLNIASAGFKCGYFSLEISNETIVSRMIGSIANIKPARIHMGLLTQSELLTMRKAEAEVLALGDLMKFYDEVYELKLILDEIRTQQYEFVIVDFIQNVIATGDEYTRLSAASLALQKVAKEANCTVLALSQLSNQVAREGAKSKVTEYKGSGSIATVADLGFFFERGDIINPVNGDNSLSLILKKNRRGPSGWTYNLAFKNPGGKVYEPVAYEPQNQVTN